jgi:DNA modification methylase
MGQKMKAIDPGLVREGRRIRMDLGNIEGLAKSIKDLGQLHPIVVINGKRKDRYELVIGARRLRACKKLGIKIRAEVVEPPEALKRLDMELHENMRRKDLDLAEESEAQARRKAIYEQLHPETKKGATLKKGPAPAETKSRLADSDKREPVKRYTLQAAEALGCSETRVKELLAIQKLPKEELEGQLKACKTTAERNKVCQGLLRQVRQQKRQKKLEDQVEAKRQQTIEDVTRPPVVLHRGNCFKLMKGEEIVDLFCTDPPYDRERSLISHTARAAIGSAVEWDKLDIGWVFKAAPMLVPGGQLLAFCPIEAVGIYEEVLKAAGLEYKLPIIWCKTNPGPAHRPTYVYATEAIIWAVKPGAKVYFEPWVDQSGGEALNWISGPICQGSERLDHPTQKPEWLITKLINRHSMEGARVFDPFAGVGTTGAVCMDLKRACTMIEKEAKYVKQARLRLEVRR